MPQCKRCGKKGFFLSLHPNGLCEECNTFVVSDVYERVRCIRDSMKVMDKSKNISTRLSRCDVILEHAQALLEYEQLGIPTIDPSPSSLISELVEERDEIIIESVTTKAENALSRADLSTSPKTSRSAANKALLEMRDGRRLLKDPSLLDSLEERIKNIVHKIHLESYLETARKAEFKGQKKRAIDQYQEALYFLRTDNIDDSLQGEKIREIEHKIEELQQ